MAISSMTGFGQATVEREGVRVKVEIRSVNHRFAEFNIRLPRDLLSLEEDIRSLLARHLARGRTDVYVALDEGTASTPSLRIHWELFDALCQAEQAAKTRSGLDGQLGTAVTQWLTFPDVLQVQAAPVSPQAVRDVVLDAVKEACDAIMAMRQREGERLAEDLHVKVHALRRVVAGLTEAATDLQPRLLERLRHRVAELAASVDESRLLTELALLAEKSSIDEELVRLQSHLDEFAASLASGSPVGRRLDFVVQEMYREVNTIGSKSADVRISKAVVDAKTLVEQLREQVQNIE